MTTTDAVRFPRGWVAIAAALIIVSGVLVLVTK
jgi:hypothetical protein